MATDSATQDLDNLWRQARAARRLLEPGWFMDLAFFANQQWLSWAGGQLHKPNLDGNRITVVENRIAGCVRTELAKMTKNRPVWVVTPNTGDEEDANASDLGERVMRYMWAHLGMHELSLKALEWSRICGAGFLKTYWDSTIGDPQDVLVGRDGKVVTDPGGKVMRGNKDDAESFSSQFKTQVQSKRVAKGDVKVEVRSPFQMFIDPICDSFPDAEWVIEESIKSKEYVLRRYGVSLKADTPANPGLVEARTMAGAGGSYMGVRIREYWCKPNSEHPNGCRTVWSQGKILKEDSKPFDPMPYVMLTGVPVPGRLWPMSVVELLRGPQTELNKVRSQMAENRNRIGNPTLLALKQSVQDSEKFETSMSLPGGVYYFDDIGSPNTVPKYLEAPPLPTYVVNEPDSIVKTIEDISGQHEVTNANVPPGVTAASAISLLQEADDTRLGLAMQDYEVQLGRFGEKVLNLVANFYTDSRTIKIAGDDGAWQIEDFKGSMLHGNTNVEVQAGSAFPQSKAAKQAMIQDWMTFFVQSGNPPHGRQLAQFLRDSGMGASDRLVQQYTEDEQQVNRENSKLAQGIPLQINPYDNDEAHIAGHTDFQKQPRYTQFPQRTQQICEQHVDLHRQRLAQVQQQAMQMQAQAQGQPPPGQPPPGPDPMQQALQAQQLQGAQQQQGAQAVQAGQQQGYQQAQSEQQQRQAEEQHTASQLSTAQRQRMELELHQQKLRHAEEMHQHRLRQQPRTGQTGGPANGR